MNLGYILRNGHLYTDATSSNVPKDLARAYIEELAAAMGLDVVEGQNGQTWNLRSGTTVPHIKDLSEKLDRWIPVAERFITQLRARLS